MNNIKIPDFDELLHAIEQQLNAHLASLSQDSLNVCYITGIHTGGVWLAEKLHRNLGFETPLGKLDISFYRDDFAQKGLHPQVLPSSLPFEMEGAHIILVDDVVMTGRTIRAALNELFDYGRPASVTLVSLIELGSRQLPIRPDICGQKLSLAPAQRVELCGPEPLSLKIIELEP